MKKIIYGFIALAALMAFQSCQKDDDEILKKVRRREYRRPWMLTRPCLKALPMDGKCVIIQVRVIIVGDIPCL